MPRFATKPGDLVLVTGGAGRVGSALCRALLDRGYRVRATVLPDDPAAGRLAGLDAELVPLDLRDEAETVRVCADVDAICHLAALMGTDAGDMAVASYWRLNVDATLHVLEGARRNGRLAKLTYASTDATYPAISPRYSPIDEHHPQEPVNLYGLTKVVGERMVRDYLTEFGVPGTILRYGAVATAAERARPTAFTLGAIRERLRDATRSHNNYLWAVIGADQRPWEHLDDLGADDTLLVALTDREGRPWLNHPTDVRDVVQGTILALESEAAVGEAFNIVGPGPVSSVEAVRFLAEAHNRPWVRAAVPFRVAYELSTARARQVLGYRPEIDFFRAVRDGLAGA